MVAYTWCVYIAVSSKYNPLLTAENYIDGSEFLTLTKADVKAMILPLGLAKKIVSLLPKKTNF